MAKVVCSEFVYVLIRVFCTVHFYNGGFKTGLTENFYCSRCGFLTCAICVIAYDNVVCVVGYYLRLFRGERSSAGSYGVLKACLIKRYNIKVALAQKNGLVFHCGVFGEVHGEKKSVF